MAETAKMNSQYSTSYSSLIQYIIIIIITDEYDLGGTYNVNSQSRDN